MGKLTSNPLYRAIEGSSGADVRLRRSNTSQQTLKQRRVSGAAHRSAKTKPINLNRQIGRNTRSSGSTKVPKRSIGAKVTKSARTSKATKAAKSTKSTKAKINPLAAALAVGGVAAGMAAVKAKQAAKTNAQKAKEELSFVGASNQPRFLRLSNLSPKVSEADVIEIMSKYGKIARVLCTKTDGSVTAEVFYTSDNSINKAMQDLVGKRADDRKLRVQVGRNSQTVKDPQEWRKIVQYVIQQQRHSRKAR